MNVTLYGGYRYAFVFEKNKVATGLTSCILLKLSIQGCKSNGVCLTGVRHLYQGHYRHDEPNGIQLPAGMGFFEDRVQDQKKATQYVQRQVTDGLACYDVQAV